jgi:hypothetical protein
MDAAAVLLSDVSERLRGVAFEAARIGHGQDHNFTTSPET